MADTLYIKRNDLQPYYLAQARDSDDAVIDLTGATIVFTMKVYNSDGTTGTVKVSRQSVSITDATNGKCEYRWASADTDTAGNYIVEFEVTPASGGKFTIPNPRYGKALVTVEADLDST